MTRQRILVVDDDRGMVETLCDILELHGWDTLRAYDGDAAVEMVRTHDVGVVLMDVRMPRLDGVDALPLMRQHAPHVRVVLMTAYARHELLARAERDGALTVLRKPVDVSALLALLRDAVSRAGSVLVVDDDPGYLATLADVLRTSGVTVAEARRLDDALALLRDSPPGAVLLDLKLEDVDPHTSILAIKDISPSVLLILYSGHRAELEATVAATPRGLVAAAFTKPLVVDDLLAALHVDVDR
jgi:DNA-binding NtrC family response regulator